MSYCILKPADVSDESDETDSESKLILKNKKKWLDKSKGIKPTIESQNSNIKKEM